MPLPRRGRLSVETGRFVTLFGKRRPVEGRALFRHEEFKMDSSW
jgi:hypothetical protein